MDALHTNGAREEDSVKCEFCRFQPPVGAEGYQDECGYFEKYGKVWKDGREGCTLTFAQLQKAEEERDLMYEQMGIDMGLEMDFDHYGYSADRAVKLAKHMLGMDHRKTYRRHGKDFYKPYRNYFCGHDDQLSLMARHRLMDEIPDEKYTWYSLTNAGIRWLSRKTGIVIREMED